MPEQELPTNEEVRHIVMAYESHCEQYWDDLVGEMAMKYGISEETAEKILNERGE